MMYRCDLCPAWIACGRVCPVCAWRPAYNGDLAAYMRRLRDNADVIEQLEQRTLIEKQ